ncbi:MAG: hypothetical protein EBT93_09220 [Alphaproteobacteria bacterium]|nr:hypothetical protein [Alphaproteobacteria bacterium]
MLLIQGTDRSRWPVTPALTFHTIIANVIVDILTKINRPSFCRRSPSHTTKIRSGIRPVIQPVYFRLRQDMCVIGNPGGIYLHHRLVVEGGLSHADLRFEDQIAVTVIMANGGYPGPYTKGATIKGLDAEMANTMVFHAGTGKAANGEIIATGGRVLAVTGLGKDAAEARKNAYERLSHITWDGVMYR